MKKVFLLFLLFITIHGYSQVHVTARFDSVWTGYFRLNDGGWTAGDATISVPLPDGRVIWLFGDSYTVAVDTNTNSLPCLFQVRNCFMVQDSVNPAKFKTVLDTTMTGVNMTTFKLVPNDTTLFWPGHGYVNNDTVYVFLERYSSGNLAYEGCYLAKLTFPGLQQVGIFPVHENGPNAIFGRAVVVDSVNDLLYIYGNKLNWIVWEPVVARCNLSNPLQPWEYYTGTGWSEIPEQAQKIGNDPVSPGFSVFKESGKYYLISQENGYLECGLGRDIYSYQSISPWGPFTGKKLLYTEQSQFNDAFLLTYNAQAHPWNIEDNELLISYNVNDRVDTVLPNVCPSQCKHIWTDRMDADTYRPKFVRVPIGLITGTGYEPMDDKTVDVPMISIKPERNPVQPGLHFMCEIIAAGPVTGHLVLTDICGRVISSEPVALHRGKNNLPMMSPVIKGLFLLSFRGSVTGQRNVKLVVQ